MAPRHVGHSRIPPVLLRPGQAHGDRLATVEAANITGFIPADGQVITGVVVFADAAGTFLKHCICCR